MVATAGTKIMSRPARVDVTGHTNPAGQGPAWRRITVEVGTATLPVEATEAIGDERRSLSRWLVEMRPGFAAYETKASRIFPMFRLTRLP